MIELLMFDADGVLFESYESNIAYYNAIFAQVGEPPLNHDEEIKSISYAAADVFVLRARDDAALLARMKDVARCIDQATFFRLMRPPFALRPFMLALKPKYRLGLATNRSATVPGLVTHFELDGIFDAIASALDRVAPKPAPDILNLCLERAQVSAEHAVYIGDSPIDREAAEAAGVHFIAVGARVEHRHRIGGLGELTGALELVALEAGAAAVSGIRRATGSTR